MSETPKQGDRDYGEQIVDKLNSVPEVANSKTAQEFIDAFRPSKHRHEEPAPDPEQQA